MSPIVTLQIATDAVPWVSLERLAELQEQAREIAGAPEVRAVILTGGQRHFCAGASLDLLSGDDAAATLSTFMRMLPELVFDIPVPVLASMSGHAVGGGWMFGLWCDQFLMSRRALYGANFVDIGITPGMGATARLPALFGEVLADELLFSGALHRGQTLVERNPALGSVILPPDALDDAAAAWAERICGVDPVAVRGLKRLRVAQRRRMLRDALAAEEPMLAELFAGDVRERLRQRYPERAR